MGEGYVEHGVHYSLVYNIYIYNGRFESISRQDRAHLMSMASLQMPGIQHISCGN